MIVTKTENLDGTYQIVLNEVNNDDLKHLYLRVSLMNDSITTAMGDGYGDKNVPDTSFGCEFCGVFDGIWEDG